MLLGHLLLCRVTNRRHSIELNALLFHDMLSSNLISGELLSLFDRARS